MLVGSLRKRAARSSVVIPACLLISVLAGGGAYADDCPDARTARGGFVLERPGVRTEVRQSKEQVTIVTNKFTGETPQTQFLVRGLIEVFRTSSTGQHVALPMADLRKAFPLKEGKEQEVSWLGLDPKNQRIEPTSMSVKVTGKETIRLGDCLYDVLAVRQVLTDGDGEVLDARVSLYSPDLQAVLARRYDEGTAQEATVAYEKITDLKE